MISWKDRSAIVRLAARYRAERVLVFGSSADPGRRSRDIDIAVEGVPAADFFRLYGDLLFAVSKPVDLIDLSGDSVFCRLVRRDGKPLYAKPRRTD